jgi:hypothetical protein
MSSIDFSGERTLSLAAAARLLPPGRRGRPVTLSCVLRWVLDGVKTPQGIVRLEAVRLGGRWLTSVEALERFADRQTPKFDPDAVTAPTPRTSAQCHRASERVERELNRLGI